jgi:hypothetical protein
MCPAAVRSRVLLSLPTQLTNYLHMPPHSEEATQAIRARQELQSCLGVHSTDRSFFITFFLAGLCVPSDAALPSIPPPARGFRCCPSFSALPGRFRGRSPWVLPIAALAILCPPQPPLFIAPPPGYSSGGARRLMEVFPQLPFALCRPSGYTHTPLSWPPWPPVAGTCTRHHPNAHGAL